MDADRSPTDADRQAVVAALRSHAGSGAIDLDEFGLRTERALAAPTVADLQAVVADLPGAPVALPSTSAPVPMAVPRHRARPVLWARLAPVAPLAVLFVAIWAVTGFGYFWPVWPIMGISIGALKHGRIWGCASHRRTHWV